uniref:Uncharacterized protein n=1 Tax=Meloidogyne enterolobii TaxID=390850 RepID=A0A6V7XGJ4_MELEN|nr:unnamed protein product [Meloidogyne enterolobii]
MTPQPPPPVVPKKWGIPQYPPIKDPPPSRPPNYPQITPNLPVDPQFSSIPPVDPPNDPPPRQNMSLPNSSIGSGFHTSELYPKARVVIQ